VEPPEKTSESSKPKRGLFSPHVWVSTTYFGEGFPYSIVNNIAEVLFKEMGASLEAIGLTALFHLPWNLKFLWGPFLDHYETKRRWLLFVEVVLSVLLVVLAFLASGAQWLGAVAVCFLVIAVLSATHDIAIDGFYLESLDEKGQSKFVGYRAMAYKVSSLIVRGPLLALCGIIGWTSGFLVAAAIMVAMTALHWHILPNVEGRKHPIRALLGEILGPRVLIVGAGLAGIVAAQRHWRFLDPIVAAVSNTIEGAPVLQKVSLPGWIALTLLAVLLVLLAFRRPIQRRIAASQSYYGAAFVQFLARDKVGRILAFVVLFRTGESFLQKMKWPFLNDVLAMSLRDYGTINGTLGVIASFVGTFLGGLLISRHGLKRWLWPFVLAQNTTNLLYAVLAWAGASGSVGLGFITTMMTIEHFGEGLGTAVFMVYLMRCCDPQHKAAHMAILTALMSISFTFAGVASGFLVVQMGYFYYFVFTFVASMPGMALIFILPNRR